MEAAAGTGWGAGWGSLPLAHWEAHATLTSWMKVRSGFQTLGLLLPTQPGQLDPPKTGSLLSAAFYRTIKPEVQVRSLRPVTRRVRLCLSCSPPFSSLQWLLPLAEPSNCLPSQPFEDPTTPRGTRTCPGGGSGQGD